MKNVVFEVAYGRVIATTSKIQTEDRITVVNDVRFKGNPEAHANALIKMHTASGALGIIDTMNKVAPIDIYWKNVRGYITRAIRGRPASQALQQ
jgi:hypothetical protein